MFIVIYKKFNGEVVSITAECDQNELRKSISDDCDFISVEQLPQLNHYRQIMKVVDNALTVENLQLTAEQEKEISYMETIIQINDYKKKLEDSDYKALKFIDGEFTEEEYAPIREERKNYRIKINELEKCLENFG